VKQTKTEKKIVVVLWQPLHTKIKPRTDGTERRGEGREGESPRMSLAPASLPTLPDFLRSIPQVLVERGSGKHWRDLEMAYLICLDLHNAPKHFGIELVTFDTGDTSELDCICILARVAKIHGGAAVNTKVVVGVNASHEVDPFQLAAVVDAAGQWVADKGIISTEEARLPRLCLMAACDGPIISYQRVSGRLALKSEIGFMG
jgi:hypothetical protein